LNSFVLTDVPQVYVFFIESPVVLNPCLFFRLFLNFFMASSGIAFEASCS